MKQRVEHPVRPLELAPGERTDPLEDGVAVALTLGQDREHERCGRGGNEVFVDVHSHLELLCIEAQGTTVRKRLATPTLPRTSTSRVSCQGRQRGRNR